MFVYLREIYGDLLAFPFGWTMLFIGPAGIGAIALVFAEYLTSVIPGSAWAIRWIATVVLLAVSCATYRSVTGVGAVVTAASGAKVAAIAVLVLTAFMVGTGANGSFGGGAATEPVRWGGVGVALVAAL